MTDLTPPAHIKRVLQKLLESGYPAYLVGGGVRDAILGRAARDWDIASSALPEEVAQIFEKTVPTGARFGTMTVILPECKVEVTTFRADGKYRDSRRPESVEFAQNLTDDLSRRDFTMNAIAISDSGALIDPFGGVEDIKNGVIRSVGDAETRFGEDALRMLRALRFSAELGFTVEPQTLKAITKLAPDCVKLSGERVRDELHKTLMSERPELLGDMLAMGLLAGRVRRFARPEGLEKLKELPPEPSLRWCAFCAALLRGELIESVREFLSAGLRQDGKTTAACTTGSELARSGLLDTKTGIKHLLARHGEGAVLCAAAADFMLRGGNAPEAVDEILRSGECYSLKGLAVSGGDLIARGVSPGRELGAILDAMLRRVIIAPDDNTRETLLGDASYFPSEKEK